MAFESVPPVPTADMLVSQMLAAGRSVKVKAKKTDDALARKRKRSREQLTAMSGSLAGALRAVPRGFPDTNDLLEFYRALFSEDFSLDDYRKRLARVQHSAGILSSLTRQFRGKVEQAGTPDALDEVMRQAMGRFTSVAKRLDPDLSWLAEVRTQMREYPTIKQEFTICIAGFPNVGKTTLFVELTGAGAEINDYAFTTKRLNAGSTRFEGRKVQFIDTPGTLNRATTNRIERQAQYALRYAADLIVYVYDPTDTYSLERQDALREQIEELGKPMIIFTSKEDIASPERLAFLVNERGAMTREELREELSKRVQDAS